MAIPAILLLVACTNLANLVLSRGMSRRNEFAVRRALGASRGRLIAEELVESAMITAAGVFGGVLTARAILAAASAIVADRFGYIAELPQHLHLSAGTLMAVGVTAIVSVVTAGLLPALQLTRVSLRASLASDTGASALPRWRGRGNLIALQVAVSTALFLAAAVVFRLPPAASEAGDPGRHLPGLAAVEVPFALQQIGSDRALATIDRALDDARRIVGVTSAAAANLTDAESGFMTSVDEPFTERVKGHRVAIVAATADLFSTLEIGLRAGRAFDARDTRGAQPVVVLNERAARDLFRRTDVVGRTVLGHDAGEAATGRAVVGREVVGVVPDTTLLYTGQPQAIAYVPLPQRFAPGVVVLARGAEDDAAPLVGALTAAVRRADPDLAVRFAGRADALFHASAVARLLAGEVAASLAALALVLATAGLYGVLSHVVSHRTREMGVRIALGAGKGDIVRLVGRDGLRPVVEGVGIGLVAGLLIRLAIRSQMTMPFTAFDPVAIAAAAVPLAIAGAIACYLPARRAARVDPNVALRDL